MVPKSEIYNQNRVSKRTHHSTAFKPSIKLIFESISKSYSKSDIIPSILFEFSINNCMVQYRKIEIDASKDSSDIALMFPLKNCVLANFSVSDLSILMPLCVYHVHFHIVHQKKYIRFEKMLVGGTPLKLKKQKMTQNCINF